MQKHSFHEKNHFYVVELLLKLHLDTFLTEKEAFEHLWPRILIICLVCTKQELVFLEAPKKCFLQLSSKMTFLQKAQTRENQSSALQKTLATFSD